MVIIMIVTVGVTVFVAKQRNQWRCDLYKIISPLVFYGNHSVGIVIVTSVYFSNSLSNLIEQLLS